MIPPGLDDYLAEVQTTMQISLVADTTGVADLPGTVDRIAFESGGSVKEGDLLVQLDTRQEQAQLTAIEAERDLARLNFERLQGLVNEGAITRAEYDRAAAEQKQTEARVGEIRAAIDRKTIRAPFSFKWKSSKKADVSFGTADARS